jgi:nondiscriminating glutamyl-tRNA synthetase
MSEVRVRFAPSPTGFLHIGNVRTALFNFLFARHQGGKFILRIEDTDVERSSVSSELSILEDLRWLGLSWDEGPDIGGAHGPYRQSERISLYQESADKLLKEGKAYPCFCSEEELKKKSEALLAKGIAPKYDGKCLKLTVEERMGFERKGIKPAIRFKVEEESVEVDDLIHGHVTFLRKEIGDFIIVRSDGIAAYNFAVVVDDALMKISHVIRGDGHLTNTPRQILVAKALNFDIPRFAHHSLTLGADGTPLSKRHGATSLTYYRQEGYLPQALLNFLALLGWSPEHGEEIISLDEMIKQFTLDRVGKSGAVFNPDKLNWVNRVYIKQLSTEELTKLALPYLEGMNWQKRGVGWLQEVVETVRNYLNHLSQIREEVKIFLNPLPPLPETEKGILKEGKALEVIHSYRRKIEKLDQVNLENYVQMVNQVKEEVKVKGKPLYLPLRIALTGKMEGPELEKIFILLGKEESLRRIEETLQQV